MNALGLIDKIGSNTHLEGDPQKYPYLSHVLETLTEEILEQTSQSPGHHVPLSSKKLLGNEFFNGTTPKLATKCTLYVVQPSPSCLNNLVENNTFTPDTNIWSSSDAASLIDKKSCEAIKDIFKNINFDGAYCSYAQRTYDTARIILGDRQIEIIPRNEFSEMRVGPTAGETVDKIKQFFLKETGYPGESTEITLPKVWAKRQGGPIEAEDVFLDRWRDDLDTFDDFSAQFIKRIKEFAANNLHKTFLIVPHDIHMRSMIAEAKGTTSDRVTCTNGSFYKIEIDIHGNFHLKKALQEGITLS